MEYYTIKELSERLKLNIQTLRRYIKEGRLKASKVGRSYYVSEDQLAAFMSESRQTNCRKIKLN